MSDSDIEGPAGEEAAARVRDPAEERRAAAEVLRQLRPEQDVRRLAVLVDPAILEDAGADILMEALDALSCEYRVEPERPAWSLRWSRVKPDPCSLSVPPEVWAADEQDWLLLLEPEEFLQGVVQLTQPQTRGTAADNMQSKLRKTQGRRRQQEEPTSHEAVLLIGSRPASQACSPSPDMLGQQLSRDSEKESGCSHTRHRKQTD